MEHWFLTINTEQPMTSVRSTRFIYECAIKILEKGLGCPSQSNLQQSFGDRFGGYAHDYDETTW